MPTPREIQIDSYTIWLTWHGSVHIYHQLNHLNRCSWCSSGGCAGGGYSCTQYPQQPLDSFPKNVQNAALFMLLKAGGKSGFSQFL